MRINGGKEVVRERSQRDGNNRDRITGHDLNLVSRLIGIGFRGIFETFDTRNRKDPESISLGSKLMRIIGAGKEKRSV